MVLEILQGVWLVVTLSGSAKTRPAEKLCVEIEIAIDIAMKSEIATEHNTWVWRRKHRDLESMREIPYCLHVIVDGMIVLGAGICSKALWRFQRDFG